MKKTKKITLIIGVSILSLAVLCLILYALLGAVFSKSYETAKRESESYLWIHKTKLEKIALECFSSKEKGGKEDSAYRYSFDPNQELVCFEVDSQGMLGGQYWELVYTKDGTLYGQTKTYLQTFHGGNVIKAERIDEHWWFLWTDYDAGGKSYR